MHDSLSASAKLDFSWKELFLLSLFIDVSYFIRTLQSLFVGAFSSALVTVFVLETFSELV